MKIEKMAALANIGALFTGLYSAYGTWTLLHPTAPNSTAIAVPAGSTIAAPHLFLSLFVAACAVIFAAVVNVIVFIRRRKGDVVNVEGTPPLEGGRKLTIHSAFYGSSPLDEVSVMDRLKDYVRDGLVIPVNNNLVPSDPAPSKPGGKRLRVKYSYGNDSIFEASRPEHGRMVLPEDSEISHLTKELHSVKEAAASATEVQHKDIQHTIGVSSREAKLEIRPLPGKLSGPVINRATHFRMEIYNPPTEKTQTVQVKLVEIEPLPMSTLFLTRRDFPYHVRHARSSEGPVDVNHDIYPGTSEQFELLYSWESSDGNIMIDGIDTKQALSRDARFSIEDNECWHLKYEVISALSGIQRPIFCVRRKGQNLFVSRLV